MADDVTLLLRRATFGPRPAEVAAARAAGYAGTVDALLRTAPDLGGLPALGPEPDRKDAKARRDQVQQITLWWLDRMATAAHPFGERLTFFWHGHWATSVQKVRSARMMLAQNQTFRAYGRGDFRELAQRMVVDPALLVWLDAGQNSRKAPNENLGRELMELFTLGVGHYTETDVREAARALTGWRVDRAAGTAALVPARHDTGSKTILGHAGDYDAHGLIDLLVTQPVSAAFVAARLWFRYAGGTPSPATAARLTSAYGAGRDVTALLRALFTDPAFTGTAGQLVTQPVEWAVGACRQLGVRPAGLPASRQRQLLAALRGMGQVPFTPPSVGGWPAGGAWLTTAATQARLQFAQLLVAAAGSTGLAPVASAADRVAAVGSLLAVDEWTPRTRAVLSAAASDPARLVTLALVSPEYVVS
jgi:uncharacterized protein (DUF1800 family)